MTTATRSQKEYQERIHQAIDYINKHLSEEINLDKLSEAACFSPFHFHRIFTNFIGETPRDFIERLRLERAANCLISRPNESVTEVAYYCGFGSLSSFSRAFKKRYAISPRDFFAKHKEDFHSLYISENRRKLNFGKNNVSTVEIKILPPMHIAYAERLDGYRKGIMQAWMILNRYAGARDLIKSNTLHIGMPLDNPNITPIHKCRYRACIDVPKDLVIKRGEVRTDDLAGGKYAVYHFQGTVADISSAYEAFYGLWLPNSGYIPSDRPVLEIYPPGLHKNFNSAHFSYDIAMPVEPL